MLSCSYRGQTFSAHREGFHTSLSGIQFLRTLSRKPCRAALLTFARACGNHVTQLMRLGAGRRAQVGSDVFLKLMEELSSITLAVRAGGKQLRMSRYKRWLSSRGLSTVLSWPLHGVRCSRGLSTGLRGSASPPFALAAYRIIYGELCMKDGHVSEGL